MAFHHLPCAPAKQPTVSCPIRIQVTTTPPFLHSAQESHVQPGRVPTPLEHHVGRAMQKRWQDSLLPVPATPTPTPGHQQCCPGLLYADLLLLLLLFLLRLFLPDRRQKSGKRA
jgi:hypothetical protein